MSRLTAVASLAVVVCQMIYAPQPAVAQDNAQSNDVQWAHIEIKGSYPEGPKLPGLFGELSEGMAQALERLEKAASDDNVTGVILRIETPTIGWAKMNEFRQAVQRVRAKEKKVIAWMPAAMSMDYLLATACDEIVMPEAGFMFLVGLRSEVTFYKGLFDKLDIKADMLRIGEYKSAAEPYTRTEMSPEFRAEMEEILDDYHRQMVTTIAEGRKLERGDVERVIDSGPHTAKAAMKLGLIDRVAYEDEVEELLKPDDAETKLKITRRYAKEKSDTDFSGFTGFVKLMNLMMGVEPGQRQTANPKIAVIHASGIIMPGKSQSDLFGTEILGSDTLVKAIQDANKNDSVKAIVLRVDSPGGSALASDLIWRAIEQVEKPVVASMGDVAASGGYYISMGADVIFAEPGTLTGSIGVVGGKFALRGLFEKLGITTSVVSRGRNSGAMSMLDGFSDSERQAMMKIFHDIYAQFTKKAAAGRKMEYEKLESLARGRVYTGAMAQELKLVDQLGTLDDAIAHAKQMAGLDVDDKDVERLVLPKPVSPLEALFGPLDPDAGARMQQASAVREAFNALSPALTAELQQIEVINHLSQKGPMTLMPFRVKVR